MGLAGGAGSGSGGGSSSSGRTTTATTWDGALDTTNRSELRLNLPSRLSSEISLWCTEDLRMMEVPLKIEIEQTSLAWESKPTWLQANTLLRTVAPASGLRIPENCSPLYRNDLRNRDSSCIKIRAGVII